MQKRINKVTIALLVALLGFAVPTMGQDAQKPATTHTVNVSGDTWEIAEPDPYLEIKAALQSKKEVIRKEFQEIWKTKLNSYVSPEGSFKLARALNNEKYKVDTTYTLDQDLNYLDDSGHLKTLYPKGFKYNILDYVALSNTYVVLDGTRKDDVQYVAEKFKDDSKVKFLVSDGLVQAARALPGNQIALLTPRVAQVFNVKASVSVVKQEGNTLIVEVIAVPTKLKTDTPIREEKRK